MDMACTLRPSGCDNGNSDESKAESEPLDTETVESYYAELADSDVHVHSKEETTKHNCPRLCHLRKIPTYTGYGFNLQSLRKPALQMIASVESGSPADVAGLHNNDILIEVNGANILSLSHQEIVDKIVSGLIRNGIRYKNEVVLLVVDQETKAYYDKRDILINYAMPGVLPVIGAAGVDRRSQERKKTSSDIQVHSTNGRDLVGEATDFAVKSSENADRDIDQVKIDPDTVQRLAEAPTAKDPKGKTLNLDMTAAEMRELLKKRGGKRDPRMCAQKISFQERHRIIRNL